MDSFNSVVGVRTDEASGRYTMLAYLCLCVILSLATWFSTTAILPQLKEHYALGDTVTQWLGISVQLGFLVGAVTSTITGLSDRIPPKQLMIWSSVAAAVANISILFVTEGAQLVALRIASGAALAGVYPPALKLISTWFVRGRGVAMGSIVGALTLGSAMPHLVNAFGGVDWRNVIIITTLLPLLSAFMVAMTVREGPFPFPKHKFDVKIIGATLSDRVFLLATFGYLGHMWELYAMWSWVLLTRWPTAPPARPELRR